MLRRTTGNVKTTQTFNVKALQDLARDGREGVVLLSGFLGAELHASNPTMPRGTAARHGRGRQPR